MIDFRYHLVSIASIFLALAVGIVLGAGPLQNSIGSTLQNEVTNLREEKAALRTQLDASRRGERARDSFEEATLPALVRGRLDGADVVVVALPDVDQQLVKDTTDTLRSAGARVTGTVSVDGRMVQPASTELRERTARPLLSSLKLSPAPGEGADSAARVLAAAVVTGGQGAVTADETGRAAALTALQKAGLISVDPQGLRLARSVVVLSGSVTGEPAARSRLAAAQVSLVEALDHQAKAAVLAGPTTAPSDSTTSVVTTARKNADLIGKLSTVDDADIPMGRASVVLALAEQASGGAGQYGLGTDAKTPYPALAR